MRVLAIDTSNQPMSVAIVDQSTLLVERITNIKRNHSIQLMPAIHQMLEEAGLSMQEIDRVAVAEGPGSYTGVRIGVTVAKTLAWSTKKELVGVSSLKMLAGNVPQYADHLIAPLFDARRGNLYAGLYQWQEGNLVNVEEDTHISSKKWAEFLAQKDQPVEIIGQDALAYESLFEKELGNHFIKGSSASQVPRGSVLAELALAENPVEIHSFKPAYKKLAEAEEKWKEKNPEYNGGDFVEKI